MKGIERMTLRQPLGRRWRWPRRSRALAPVAVAGRCLAAAPAAAGAEILSAGLRLSEAGDRSCTSRPLAGGAAVARRAVTAPSTGEITARLAGTGSGDWDLAVFDADSGRTVAGSAHAGMQEVAQGFVAEGQRLVVQACRRGGGGDAARLTVEAAAISTSRQPGKVQLVRVLTPNRARVRDLQRLGLDLTEHGRPGFVDVVLHGDEDAEKLRRAKFSYTAELSAPVAEDP